jgi:hypothetical protein
MGRTAPDRAIVQAMATCEGVRPSSSAASWTARATDRSCSLIESAAIRLWQANAPVLRAIVENWQSDPRLRDLWLQQMRSFTDATIAQISEDPEAMAHLAGSDVAAVASGLTWLGERLYYLAACQVPPFADEDTLIATLVHIWASTLYGGASPGT